MLPQESCIKHYIKDEMVVAVPCSSELGSVIANQPYEIHLHIFPLRLCTPGCLMDILGQKETCQLPLVSRGNSHGIFALMDQCLSPSSGLCFLCKSGKKRNSIEQLVISTVIEKAGKTGYNKQLNKPQGLA